MMHPYSPYMRAPAAATYRPGYHGYGRVTSYKKPVWIRYYDRHLTDEEAAAWARTLMQMVYEARLESISSPPIPWMSLTPYEQDAMLRYNAEARRTMGGTGTLGPLLWLNGVVGRPEESIVRRALGLGGYGNEGEGDPGSPLMRLGKGLGVIWGLAALVLFVAFKAK